MGETLTICIWKTKIEMSMNSTIVANKNPSCYIKENKNTIYIICKIMANLDGK